MSTVSRSNRYFSVTSADHGNILEIGPPSTVSNVGGFTVQFKPSADFQGSFAVVGKAMGQAATDKAAPFEAIPYRRVNVGGAASDYAIVADVIANTGIIQVPANGMSVGFLTACTTGTCDVFVWDMNGSTAI